MSFAKSIQAFQKKAEIEIDTAVNKKAAVLFNKVVFYSPTKPAAQYAKGEFINNWIAMPNGIATGTRSARNYNGMASLTSIATVAKAKTFYKRDGKVTLTNNTSYGFRVEFAGWPKTEGQRWSGQVGPYAPVAKAFINRKTP